MLGLGAVCRAAFGPTASQPMGVAVSEDGFVFVAEAGHVEVVRSAQRVCAVNAPYTAISIDVHAGVVAVGGAVRVPSACIVGAALIRVVVGREGAPVQLVHGGNAERGGGAGGK